MTEAEWLTSDQHLILASFVSERTSLRKLRLAVAAICRRVAHHFVDERSWRALEVSEAHADGLVSDEALIEAHSQACDGVTSLQLRYNSQWNATLGAATTVAYATGTESDLRRQTGLIDIFLYAPKPPPDSDLPEITPGSVAEANLVRDVFGNPFRPVAFNPAWRTDTALTLARQMYDSRDFGAMPILADALQDAGCDSEDVLNHCRDASAPHIRGCWVVDLVLGKE
jgi:hypothetical protein